MESAIARLAKTNNLMGFYSLVLAVIAGILTILDVTLYFLYLPYLPIACIVVVLSCLFAFVPTGSAWIRFSLLALFVLWLFVLPSIRWHRTKAFFIDANRIQVNMNYEQVHEIMSPYLELDYRHPHPHSNDCAMFKPEEGGGNYCQVCFQNGVVTSVESAPD